MSTRPSSIEALADYLATGYWRDTGQIPHHFSGHTISVNLSGLNAAGKALARQALDAWEDVADLHFKEVGSGGQIRFADDGSGATTNVTMTTGGSIMSATVSIAASWVQTYGASVGSYGFQTYLHEIGHALGLGHSADYNGSADVGDIRFSSDSWQTTVMSYFDQNENPAVQASKAYVITPMMADILAIQKLYGRADGGDTAGRTTWGKNVDLQRNAMTISDTGGEDTLDLGRWGQDHRLDLNDGAYSNVAGQVGNLGIAFRTVIENAVLGSGDDRVTGNQAGNRLVLGDGRDTASGKSGNDRIYGGDGSDRMDGGAANDKLYGQGGSDKLDGGGGDDLLVGGSGGDTFRFVGGRDTIADFADDQDTIQIDRGVFSGAASVAKALGAATVSGGDVVFNFGGGDVLRVRGVTDIGALADDLAFV